MTPNNTTPPRPDGEETGEAGMLASNWGQLHHRLEAAQAAIERTLDPTPVEKANLLKARAKALARASGDAPAAELHIEILEFLVANEKYGIESTPVREVYPLQQLTPLPCTPRFVLGIVNVRGQIVSVIDIKAFFDLPEKGLSDLNKVIILHSDEMEFGILADEILGVRSIPLDDLQPSLPTLTGIRAEYLKGVTEERTVILDAAKLLSDRSIVVHEEIEA